MNRKLRRIMRKRKRKWIIASIVLFLAGTALVLRVPFFYLYSWTQGNRVLREANKIVESKPSPPPKHVEIGQTLGEVIVPSLSLTAPLIQGAGDAQLAVAAGHYPTSVLPGQSGTSIIDAHNATWFQHINLLKPGDKITVKTTYGTFEYNVTGSSKVHEGDGLRNTKDPSLVLETCFPLNALYFTPYRYLVFANLGQTSGETKIANQPLDATYTVQIPKSLGKDDLTFKTNNLPMGSLSYSGHPSQSFSQSNAPLNVSNALVRLYLAWVHANMKCDTAAVDELTKMPNGNPLLGFNLNKHEYLSPFDITINVDGQRVQSLSAVTTVRIHHKFTIHIEATVSPNNEVKLDSIIINRE